LQPDILKIFLAKLPEKEVRLHRDALQLDIRLTLEAWDNLNAE